MEPPKKIIEQIFDFCLTLAIAALLLRFTVWVLQQIWPYLAIIAAVVVAIAIIYHVWKHHNDNMGQW